ncbi:MAG: tetratricopeptide repeat protein [Candidatus Cloacimonadota bacterium]|nr:MAG: tetratricopeptide repeat protein [Candidatus Cloacimonadota bacterium]
MKIPLRAITAALVLLIMIASCVKRQEILLYEEKGESIPAVDSLYDYSKNLYKNAQYKEAIQYSKNIIDKYPTSEKVDEALSLLLLSKYRLKDYRGIINSVAGKEKLYKGRSAEADILYITAQSLEKLGKKNDAAKTYFDILKLPIKTNLKDKSEENLEKLIEKELTFSEVRKLASRYEKTSLGCFTLYYAARKGLSLGKEQEARKIYNHMKRLYPNNKLTLEITEMLKGEKFVTLTGGAIGFLAPLTEEYGIFGKRVKKGFELALKGKSLKVISGDTRGSPLGAFEEII